MMWPKIKPECLFWMKLMHPTSEAPLKLNGPQENLYELSMSTVDHPRTPNILDCLTNLSEYLCGGMTRPRIFTFSFVSSVSGKYMLSELYFEDFCVVFSWVKSLG